MEETMEDFATLLQSSVWISSPEYAGWLTKKTSGIMSKAVIFKSRAWRRKWVALHGDEIVYMDKEPTRDNLATIKIVRCHIDSDTVLATEDEENDHQFNYHSFVIHYKEDNPALSWHMRAESEDEKHNWLIKLGQVQSIVKWFQQFERLRVLGVGGQGAVYELRNKNTGKHYAIKELEIKSDSQMKQALQEANMLKDIMQNVQHPNILCIEKVFQIGSKFHLVFPVCTGGELFERIVDRGHFSEDDAAGVIHDLISALDALHQHGILHLDIKPENILFETKDPNAMIKVTDFGLSKLFSEVGGKRKAPTQAEIEEKKRKFLDYGELDYCDKVCGTYGYMSPELVLTGHYSTATDVFASGVVLFILLCGYPPFASKSNRQTLTKTINGNYNLCTPQWSHISPQAIDLVRRMLDPCLSTRISTADILKHPWILRKQEQSFLSALPEVQVGAADDEFANETYDAMAHYQAMVHPPTAPTTKSTQNLVAPSTSAVPPVPSVPPRSATSRIETSSKKSSTSGRNEHLAKTISELKQHVQKLRSEKLAKTMTKLVSAIHQQGGGSNSKFSLTGNNTLSDAYLTPLHYTATEQCTPNAKLYSQEHLMAIVNGDVKSALAAALRDRFSDKTGETEAHDRLSIEQVLEVMKQFGLGPASNSTPTANASITVGLGGLLLCRFMDRDDDGWISADDILTTQVLIMQRDESFLRLVFRMYTEVVWYPGRNINFLNVLQHTNLKGSPHGSEKAEETTSRKSSESLDVVEPPKYITAKHVSLMFEKFGYDPANGAKVFRILCEAVLRVQHHTHRIDGIIEEEEGEEEEDDQKPKEQAPGPPAQEHQVDLTPGHPQRKTSIMDHIGKGPIADRLSNRWKNRESSRNERMDVEEFIRAVRMDDVLVQVLFKHSRNMVCSLIEKAEIRAAEGGAGKPLFEVDCCNSADGTGDEHHRSALEEELTEAFKKVRVTGGGDRSSASMFGGIFS